MTRRSFESEYIFGIHEPGGEQNMRDAGKPGWIVFTEGIGDDPNARGGRDYRQWSNQGFGVISRLNNGYFPNGTIPRSDRYDEFAQRCANFAAASNGCHIWIIGNEMNFQVERPMAAAAVQSAAVPLQATSRGGWSGFTRWLRNLLTIDAPTADPAPTTVGPVDIDEADPLRRGSPQRFNAITEQERGVQRSGGDEETLAAAAVAAADASGQVITPEMYVRCYTLCRSAIRSRPGHEGDLVIIGAVAPWNNQTQYPGNPNGDWIVYFQDILRQLGPSGCDGIALHTYTHGADPALIRSEARMNPPFNNRRFHFRAYQDFMGAIPGNMRNLPVYITETNEDVAWRNENIGWVQQAYGEIDFWNRQPGNQAIRALCLYRWPQIDKWYIEGKQGVIEDFRQALRFDYQWQRGEPVTFNPGDTVETLDATNLRRSPGYRSKPVTDVVVTVAQGGRLRVRSGGPRQADGLTWWPVDILSAPNGATGSGWMAQFAPNGTPLMGLVKRAEPGDPNALAVGDRARTLTAVNIRRTPGYLNQATNDVIATLPQNANVNIVDGPQRRDSLIWWRVQTTSGRSLTGWMAESVGNTRLLQKVQAQASVFAAASNASGGRFAPGVRAITQSYASLRRTPGYFNQPSGDILRTLAPATTVQIIDGPQRANSLTWWQVDVPGVGRGWLAETAPNGFEILAETSTPAPSPSNRFEPGDRARTLTTVRFRRSPGYRNQPGNDIIGDVAPNTIVTVRGGPRSADGLTWWQVDVPANASTSGQGWMADTAPGGIDLLAEVAGEPTPPTPPEPPSQAFQRGDIIQAVADARVRRSPGYQNKPGDDVIAGMRAQTTLNIIDGPRSADGLTWWRVGGISSLGREVVGWVAQTAPDGTILLDRAPKLPGTDVPNPGANRYLAAPYPGSFGIAQLWGENPQIYSRIRYDGVPLIGHNGVDFLTPVGVEMRATDGGTVSQAGFDNGGFGNYVLIRHPWGESLYAHLSRIDVRVGQRVDRGQRIGLSGNSGNSTGPHLHFAIRINPYNRRDGWGGYSDPLPYLSPRDYSLPPYVQPVRASAATVAAANAPMERNATSFEPSPLLPEPPGERRP